jgi:catechol-2,3-dioxygenase
MAALSPSIALGPVRLAVADLAGAAAFYERVVGLRPLADAAEGADAAVRLSAGGPALVELVA